MKIAFRAFVGLAALLALTAVRPALGQEAYPVKPIRIVIGFSAGTGQDLILRSIGVKLAEGLGVPIVVDNKDGANGNIAAALVARAPADGYTLLFNTSSIVLSPYLYANPGYDLLKDFAAVVLTTNVPMMLVAHPDVPAANIQEFVAWLKANPGKVNYGSGGHGNVTHLSAALFLNAVGAQATHVPYKGQPAAMTDLMAGRIQFLIGLASSTIPHLRTKKMRGLGVATLKRLEAIPEVPTLAETVMPGMEIGAWSGVLAPSATPAAVVERLNGALNKSLEDPALRAKIVATSAEVKGSTFQQYTAFLKTELGRWGGTIRSAGLKPE